MPGDAGRNARRVTLDETGFPFHDKSVAEGAHLQVVLHHFLIRPDADQRLGAVLADPEGNARDRIGVRLMPSHVDPLKMLCSVDVPSVLLLGISLFRGLRVNHVPHAPRSRGGIQSKEGDVVLPIGGCQVRACLGELDDVNRRRGVPEGGDVLQGRRVHHLQDASGEANCQESFRLALRLRHLNLRAHREAPRSQHRRRRCAHARRHGLRRIVIVDARSHRHESLLVKVPELHRSIQNANGQHRGDRVHRQRVDLVGDALDQHDSPSRVRFDLVKQFGGEADDVGLGGADDEVGSDRICALPVFEHAPVLLGRGERDGRDLTSADVFKPHLQAEERIVDAHRSIVSACHEAIAEGGEAPDRRIGQVHHLHGRAHQATVRVAGIQALQRRVQRSWSVPEDHISIRGRRHGLVGVPQEETVREDTEALAEAVPGDAAGLVAQAAALPAPEQRGLLPRRENLVHVARVQSHAVLPIRDLDPKGAGGTLSVFRPLPHAQLLRLVVRIPVGQQDQGAGIFRQVQGQDARVERTEDRAQGRAVRTLPHHDHAIFSQVARDHKAPIRVARAAADGVAVALEERLRAVLKVEDHAGVRRGVKQRIALGRRQTVNATHGVLVEAERPLQAERQRVHAHSRFTGTPCPESGGCTAKDAQSALSISQPLLL
eukprot:scaffold680_cov264-Pinguiococcus_pyrenoidosus.AAC.6